MLWEVVRVTSIRSMVGILQHRSPSPNLTGLSASSRSRPYPVSLRNRRRGSSGLLPCSTSSPTSFSCYHEEAVSSSVFFTHSVHPRPPHSALVPPARHLARPQRQLSPFAPAALHDVGQAPTDFKLVCSLNAAVSRGSSSPTADVPPYVKQIPLMVSTARYFDYQDPLSI